MPVHMLDDAAQASFPGAERPSGTESTGPARPWFQSFISEFPPALACVIGAANWMKAMFALVKEAALIDQNLVMTDGGFNPASSRPAFVRFTQPNGKQPLTKVASSFEAFFRTLVFGPVPATFGPVFEVAVTTSSSIADVASLFARLEAAHFIPAEFDFNSVYSLCCGKHDTFTVQGRARSFFRGTFSEGTPREVVATLFAESDLHSDFTVRRFAALASNESFQQETTGFTF